MVSPRFKRATDLLCLTSPEAARLLDSTAQSVRQARLDSDKDGHRSPPSGWEKKLAKLARKRGAELFELADELEQV